MLYVYRKKKIERKSIDLKFEVSLQHAPLNSVILSPKFICTAVSNAFWKVKSLRSFASADSSLLFLTINSWRPCRIACTNFQNAGLFPARSISETKSVTPIFGISDRSIQYLTAVKVLRQSITWKIFSRKSISERCGLMMLFDHHFGFHFDLI